jgi:hypothetical protein
VRQLEFDVLEVHPIKDHGDHAEVVGDDADADFFGLYGLVSGDANTFYIPVGDFSTRDAAELTKELLMDNKKKSSLPSQEI